jgi:FeS assembly SUF system protein
MRPLPVVQPPPPAAEATPAEVKTTGMMRDADRTAALEPAIVAAIKTVFDPEIPVNIYELGLVYEILVDADSVAGIRMTLTAPACPAAQWLPQQVEEKVKAVPGVTDARVDVVFEPPWTRERMSEAARLQLGMW